MFYQQKDAYGTESDSETNWVLFKKTQVGKVQCCSLDIPSSLFFLNMAETKKDFLAVCLLFWRFQKRNAFTSGTWRKIETKCKTPLFKIIHAGLEDLCEGWEWRPRVEEKGREGRGGKGEEGKRGEGREGREREERRKERDGEGM